MNDVDFPVSRVLRGIDAASAAGLVRQGERSVKRGVNDAGVVDMARHFRESGHVLRFIEYMDVGATNGWRLDDVVPARELVERIGAVFPLEPVDAALPRRGRAAVALPRRGRRGRVHHVGHAAFLRHVHPGADLG